MLLGLLRRTTSAVWRKRHLRLHSTTFSWRNGTLLLLLSLPLNQTFVSPYVRVKEKPGKCLKERISCNASVPDLCSVDSDCGGFLKCCSFACGKKCMDPYKEPCMQPLNPGDCNDTSVRWYFDMQEYICKPFKYTGCLGNSNNFFNKKECVEACLFTVKEGRCPYFPFNNHMDCSDPCKSDNDCPGAEKCCGSMCGFVCAVPWTAKTGFCPRMPSVCPKINKPECLKDEDCPLMEKCCSRCGLRCLEPES
ncbi:WAP four-disulfide core domain protein 8 [Pteropus medius]|uniref:WAP four-disulfide core domain protein 8 n=1 Tax=Pteropus vampyrus TaxID=132908 RepID=UPI00196A1FA1|nr:WAP four-disulfide core domain protein 8 [Pteropus giganteus]